MKDLLRTGHSIHDNSWVNTPMGSIGALQKLNLSPKRQDRTADCNMRSGRAIKIK